MLWSRGWLHDMKIGQCKYEVRKTVMEKSLSSYRYVYDECTLKQWEENENISPLCDNKSLAEFTAIRTQHIYRNLLHLLIYLICHYDIQFTPRLWKLLFDEIMNNSEAFVKDFKLRRLDRDTLFYINTL